MVEALKDPYLMKSYHYYYLTFTNIIIKVNHINFENRIIHSILITLNSINLCSYNIQNLFNCIQSFQSIKLKLAFVHS